MKDIKFRVWDKEQNMMYYNAQNTYDFRCRNDGCLEENFEDVIRNENYILMQYTGIKDIDNKEVYEGDILKCKLYNGEYENYEIVWDEEGASFDALNKDKSNFMAPSIWTVSEIIGNIFENPELL